VIATVFAVLLMSVLTLVGFFSVAIRGSFQTEPLPVAVGPIAAVLFAAVWLGGIIAIPVLSSRNDVRAFGPVTGALASFVLLLLLNGIFPV